MVPDFASEITLALSHMIRTSSFPQTLIFLLCLCKHMVHVVVLIVDCLYMEASVVGTQTKGFYFIHNHMGTGRHSQMN